MQSSVIIIIIVAALIPLPRDLDISSLLSPELWFRSIASLYQLSSLDTDLRRCDDNPFIAQFRITCNTTECNRAA